MEGKATKNLLDKYAYLRKRLPGRLTIPVLTLFLESDIRKLNQAEDLETLIREIYQSPADSTYRNYIGQYYSEVTSFKTGMSAPEFTLENEAGEKRKLADFRGKVVFLDFWYGACIPCHALFEALAPVKHHFAGDPNVVFLNISIDPRPVWLAALKKFQVPGYHVFTEGKGADHPVIQSYKVMGYPTTCLIDRQGNIFLATPSSDPAELIAQIEKALGQ
jgi:peroxiredoxin